MVSEPVRCVSRTNKNGATILRILTTQLTSAAVLDELKREVAAETQDADRIILDFKKVTDISALGISALVHFYTISQKTDTEIVCCGLSEEIQNLLRTMNLDSLFPPHPNPESILV